MVEKNIQKLIIILGKRKYNSIKTRIEKLLQISIDLKEIINDQITEEQREQIIDIKASSLTHSTDSALLDLQFSTLALEEIFQGDWK